MQAANSTELGAADVPVREDGSVSSQPQPNPVIQENGRKASQSSGRDMEHRDSISTNGGKPSELKPIGIINEQNTCFLNSTFQAVRLRSIEKLKHH
jgi:hypothetical protein